MKRPQGRKLSQAEFGDHPIGWTYFLSLSIGMFLPFYENCRESQYAQEEGLEYDQAGSALGPL